MNGLDLGTMNIVAAFPDKVDDTEIVFSSERNMFAECRQNMEDPEQILEDNKYAYVKYDGNFYVIGEDCLKISEIENLFKKTGSQTSYFTSVRRPMKSGLLNTAQEQTVSLVIIKEIISRLIGPPKYKGEVVCFCSPGDPSNSDANVTYHKRVLTNVIKSLGYRAECINEAHALALSENPKAEDGNGGEEEYTGLSCSLGSGMINICLVKKQLPLLTFSIQGCGDWIDEESAKVAGVDVTTITRFKEKKFDLNNIDPMDIKQSALEIYYDAMIENIVKNFSAKFEKIPANEKIDTAFEIIVGGGTSMVPGFIEKFRSVIDGMDLPFKVKGVRMAQHPLFAVANGCLAKAMAVEKK